MEVLVYLPKERALLHSQLVVSCQIRLEWIPQGVEFPREATVKPRLKSELLTNTQIQTKLSGFRETQNREPDFPAVTWSTTRALPLDTLSVMFFHLCSSVCQRAKVLRDNPCNIPQTMGYNSISTSTHSPVWFAPSDIPHFAECQSC